MPDPDRFAIFENVYADGHALVDEVARPVAAWTRASFRQRQRGSDMAAEKMALAKAINESLRRRAGVGSRRS
ncbi:hypothetical protein STENM327S_01089 [Streptomyces tendae]